MRIKSQSLSNPQKNSKSPTELSISPFSSHSSHSNPNSIPITSHSQYSQIQPSPNPTHTSYPIPITNTPFSTPLPKSLFLAPQNHHIHPIQPPSTKSPITTHTQNPHPLQFLGPHPLPNSPFPHPNEGTPPLPPPSPPRSPSKQTKTRSRVVYRRTPTSRVSDWTRMERRLRSIQASWDRRRRAR